MSVASCHLDATLSAYADRSLPAATLLTCDQHVAICPRCQAAVDTERRLLSSLRTANTPGLSCRLESALLGLAAQAACPEPTTGPAPLRVVRRAAPAMHHSPMRALMMASLAAGASAAAAWGLTVSSVGSPVTPLPVVRLPNPAASATSTSSSAQGVLVAGARPGGLDVGRGWAQSIKLRTIEP
jgi:anti-sigma factor RsiW